MYGLFKKKRHQIISDILKNIVAANDIPNGKIAMFNEELSDLFHFSEADKISFADSNRINATDTRTPKSGNPIGVVIDTIPAAEEIVLVVVVVIALVSMIPSYVHYIT